MAKQARRGGNQNPPLLYRAPMEKIRRFIGLVDSLNTWVARVVSYLLLLLMFAVVYEVAMRYAFNSPTIWSMELNQFLLCFICALGGAYTLLSRSHVNVDIFFGRLGIRARAIVSLCTSSLIFAFLILLLIESWKMAISSWAIKEQAVSAWGPPLYPIRMIVPIGVFLIILQSIIRFIRYFIQALTGVEEIKEGATLMETRRPP